MSFLGTVATNVFGKAVDNYFNRKSMDYQAKLQEQMYRNRYQWQVEDMRKAGLNPMLSALNQNAPSMSVGLASGSSGDLGSTVNSGRHLDEVEKKQLALNSKQVDNDTQRADNDTQRKDSEIKTAATTQALNTATTNYQNAMKDANTAKSAAETASIMSQIENNKKVADAQADYYHNAGTAALTSSAAAIRNSAVNAAVGDANIKAIGINTEKAAAEFNKNKSYYEIANSPIGNKILGFSKFAGEVGGTIINSAKSVASMF